MGILKDKKLLAQRFNQRAVEFYYAANDLRKNSKRSVHVIDYCTALSFELKLKAILALRGEFEKKNKHHDIVKLFEICKICISNIDHKQLIDYYNTALEFSGRYPLTEAGDREKLNRVVSGIYEETKNHFTDTPNKSVYPFIDKNFIDNGCYKDIWKILCETLMAEDKTD